MRTFRLVLNIPHSKFGSADSCFRCSLLSDPLMRRIAGWPARKTTRSYMSVGTDFWLLAIDIHKRCQVHGGRKENLERQRHDSQGGPCVHRREKIAQTTEKSKHTHTIHDLTYDPPAQTRPKYVQDQSRRDARQYPDDKELHGSNHQHGHHGHCCLFRKDSAVPWSSDCRCSFRRCSRRGRGFGFLLVFVGQERRGECKVCGAFLSLVSWDKKARTQLSGL